MLYSEFERTPEKLQLIMRSGCAACQFGFA